MKRILTLLAVVLLTLSLPNSSAYAQWTTGALPNPKLFPNAVHFTSSNEGWVVGDDSENGRGALLHYSNGAWTAVSLPSLNSPAWSHLQDVHFTSSNEGWAVGAGEIAQGGFYGLLLHYLNGTWTYVSPPSVNSSEWSLWGVHFTSSTEGWAVGADEANGTGVLLHYSGGVWTHVSPPYVSPSWRLRGVYFTSSNEGWAVGWGEVSGNDQGILLHYLNGTWTYVTPPYVNSSEWYLWGVHLTSSNEGWAVGYDDANGRGVLLHYSGGVWTHVSPPYVSPGWSLRGVHFTSPNEGWAVGYDSENSRGVLLHYLNGTWIVVNPPYVSSGWGLQAVHFASPNKGWAVGGNLFSDVGTLINYNTTAATYEWNTTYSAKISIPGVISASDTTFGNCTLYDDGTFNCYEDEHGRDRNYTGTYTSIGSTKSSIKYQFSFDSNGLQEYKNMLTDWAEDLANDEGAEISGISFNFTSVKIPRITVSRKTNLPGKVTITIKGKVSANLNGVYATKNFSYTSKIAFQYAP